MAQKQRGFRFSLLNLFVILTLAVLFAGILGRLFVTNSPAFETLWVASVIIVPILLLVAMLFSLSAALPNKRSLRVRALLIAVAPIIGLLCLPGFYWLRSQGFTKLPAVADASWRDYERIETPTLVQEYLPSKIAQPWVWNELAKRVRSNDITGKVADQALQILHDDLRNSGRRKLNWGTDFLNKAYAANLFSEDKLLSFHEYIFHNPEMEIDRTHASRARLNFHVSNGNLWGADAFPFQLLWSVRELRIDSEKSPYVFRSHHSEYLHGRYDGKLPAGEHTFEVIMDCALVERKRLQGASPDSLSPDNWPPAAKKWQETITQKIVVHKSADEIIKLVKAKEKNPRNNIFANLFIQNRNGQKELVSHINIGSNVEVDCAFSVSAVIDGQKILLGSLIGPRRKSSRRARRIENIGNEITTAKLIFTPSRELVVSSLEIDEIWGTEITLNAVPIQRNDIVELP